MFYLRVSCLYVLSEYVILIKKCIKDIPRNLVHFMYHYTKMSYFSDSL